MPYPVLQFEMITVVKDDALGIGPVGIIATANAAQVIIIVWQTFAPGMVPVMPDGAEIAQADGVGIAGNRLKKIVAVEG